MYKKATSKQENSAAAACRRQRVGQRPLKDLALVNNQGDSYRQNKFGQVTDFMYKNNDKSYSFEYATSGDLQSIASSDGWSWTRLADAWVIRNYFDAWTVSLADCESVSVTQDGIATAGKDASQMGLPLR